MCITQAEFIEEVTLKNKKKLKLLAEGFERQSTSKDKIIDKLRDFFCYNLYTLSQEERYKMQAIGNIFPYPAKWRKETDFGVEYSKEHIREYEKYEEAFTNWCDIATQYVKTPLIQCPELTSLFIVFSSWLKLRYLENFLGFKKMDSVCGWRYNLWGFIIGKDGLAFLFGLLTSGFILFPILIILAYLYPSSNSIIITGIIAGILLVYKIIRTLFDFMYVRLGFKSKIQKLLEPDSNLCRYLSNNKIIQPSKLKELSDKIENLPAPISILISKLQNKEDVADADWKKFLMSYIELSEDEYGSEEKRNKEIMHCLDYNKLKALLQLGVNVNLQDEDGRTPLMMWCSCVGAGEYKSVELLLEYGADINIKDNKGKTAFDYIINYHLRDLFNKYRKRNNQSNSSKRNNDV